MAPSAGEFRHSLGCFATGVTIVTGRGEDGRLLGVTANSFNSVSLSPPLVLFSLARSSRSLAALRRRGVFAVNLLNEDQIELSRRFSDSHAKSWDGVAYDVGESGSPILRGALASFECHTHACHLSGDHALFIGEVTRMRCHAAGRPLLFFRGRYWTLA